MAIADEDMDYLVPMGLSDNEDTLPGVKDEESEEQV